VAQCHQCRGGAVMHTPGPWKAGFDDGSGPTMVHRDGRPGIIAETNPGCGCCAGEATDENRADARLIAAAPELLEALERMLSFAQAMPQSMGADFDVIPLARAAITKARGDV
jgi:hypothetical protein